MAVNLEFKARVKDTGALERIFVDHGAVPGGVLEQIDTYFNVEKGRLKLRESKGKKPELIYYNRDESNSKSMRSAYEILPIRNSGFKHLLESRLGVKIVVEKKRRLLLYRNARIHLDDVAGLGSYLEFEVVSCGDDEADRRLLDLLKGMAAPFVEEEMHSSYSDLLTALPSR